MEIRPILSALKRNKVGAVLIAIQLALTLAIVSNSLYIISQRVAYIGRPSGVAENELLVVNNLYIGNKLDVGPMLEADLAALRSVPGVVDAAPTNSVPLSNGGWSTGINLKPNQEKSSAHTTIYFGDDHLLATYGLQVVAGRNFNAQEISQFKRAETLQPATVIITRPLAAKLFAEEGKAFDVATAVGKQIMLGDKSTPSTIVGVVDYVQTPWVGRWADEFYQNSTIVPHLAESMFQRYVVRVAPGRLDEVRTAAEAALMKVNPLRVTKGRPFTEIREIAYRGDKAMAVMLASVCFALVVITALGIVGLASFWVTQRHKQIGTRRALGATRGAILRYFQVENALITAIGAAAGIALAIGLNIWLVQKFQMTALNPWYLPLGCAIVFALGQIAVFLPARRAASVPPAVATRSA